MYQECRDENVFHRFWLDEKENSPRWFNDGSNAWHTSWDDFKGFCDQCWKVFLIDDVALLYVEKLGDRANIHFSLLRGARIDTQDLFALRDDLFRDFQMIFGWVGAHNRGLKKLIENVGFRHDGLKMFYGESRGKVLEWQCYSKTNC